MRLQSTGGLRITTKRSISARLSASEELITVRLSVFGKLKVSPLFPSEVRISIKVACRMRHGAVEYCTIYEAIYPYATGHEKGRKSTMMRASVTFTPDMYKTLVQIGRKYLADSRPLLARAGGE